ncbi:hypothetical protein BM532_18370 [Clostridioides difficile]|nr:hypothetical protein BM532_18370 [Clostridioides difficile]
MAPAIGQLTFDATDKQIKMASGDKTVDPSDDTYVLTLTKGTAKDGDVKANVEVQDYHRVRLYSRRRFISKYNNNNSIRNSKPSSTN